MPKAISRELQQEIRKVLEEQINGESGTVVVLHMGDNPITFDAVNYLGDIGVLERREHHWRLTAYGREYWERINTPAPWYWFKQNWFGAIVATATIAASVGGIVVSALD